MADQQVNTQASETRVPSDKFYLAAILVALLGLFFSFAATFHHVELKAQGFSDAVCNVNETINCDEVANSKYAEPFGLPMGLFGIGFFAGLAIMILVARLKEDFRRDILVSYKFLVVAGCLVSVVLGGISIVEIGAVCLNCIGVYVACFLQLGVVLVLTKGLPTGISVSALTNGGTYPAVALLFTIITYSFLKPENTRNFTPDLPQDGPEFSTEALDLLNTTRQEIPISRNKYAGKGEDYRKGSDGAKVTIVEFADYQCPACRYAFEALNAVYKEYGDRVQIVFRNYPLDNACNPQIQSRFHEWACEAAVVARCAGQYGKFWQMHDRIYANQSDLNGANLLKWALEVGLTAEQVDQCRQSQSILDKIRDDVALGTKLGVTGTPSIFINGRKVEGGRSAPLLLRAVEMELR